jgi:hypothetical protein
MPKSLSLSRWIAGIVLLSVLAGSGQPGAQNKLEPSGPPGPTMKRLDDIPPTWSQILPGAERFQPVLNSEAVLDKETGLVWQRAPWGPDAVGPSRVQWGTASEGCYSMVVGGRMGWRLPQLEELLSLVVHTTDGTGLFLPSGHPFTNINAAFGYWTSTNAGPGRKYGVYLTGDLDDFIVTGSGCGSGACVGSRLYLFRASDEETDLHATWCVRGGSGAEGR